MAVHVGALMFWGAAPLLQQIAGLRSFRAGAAAGSWAGALALASALAWVPLQTAVVFDDGAAALDLPSLGTVLGQTHFGRVWLARIGLIVLGLACSRGAGPVAHRAAIAALGGALASLGLLGHAAGVPGALGGGEQAILALHLLAAGAWVGALPILWRAARTLDGAELARGLHRFSALGLGLVALVLATGAASAWWRLGSFAALATSDYGRLLLGKVTLVGLMGIAALRNRNRYTPALERAAAAGATAQVSNERAGLCRSLAFEAALGAAVIVVAALLAAAEAPH